ncbi:MAG: hypothetical protein OXG81_13805 [Acidobacteria bacterium]|nr:hypothetical protein [Acidobacteriota bacterium]
MATGGPLEQMQVERHIPGQDHGRGFQLADQWLMERRPGESVRLDRCREPRCPGRVGAATTSAGAASAAGRSGRSQRSTA